MLNGFYFGVSDERAVEAGNKFLLWNKVWLINLIPFALV